MGWCDMNIKKIAFLGVFTALNLIFILIENQIPPFIAIFPYAKIGLSNIVIFFVLVVYGFKEALIIALFKCLFIAIFSGNPSSLFYSIPSTFISLIFAGFLFRKKILTLVSASSLSAIIHNVIQIIVAMIITKTTAIIVYAPHLILIGSIAGLITGSIDYLIIKKLPLSMLGNKN
jgi:heptaprenyl diphosphate synthase